MVSTVIKHKIHELEQLHDIRILFACESGSRAWGFPSPDSDYDARFIYVHTKEWYLSIHEKRDVIELPVNAELDICGWELRKTLRLLQKHNPVLVEWMHSPIVYEVDDAFFDDFKELSSVYFSPIAAMHHYLSSGKKYYEECVNSDHVKLKKLFYCLRVTLAALWIGRNKTMPPMELEKLMAVIQEKELLTRIKELVQLKALKDESYLHSHEPALEHFLKESLIFCDSVVSSLPRSITDDTLLDAFFRRMLQLGSVNHG